MGPNGPFNISETLKKFEYNHMILKRAQSTKF